MSEQLDSYRAQLRDEIDTENTYRSRIEPVSVDESESPAQPKPGIWERLRLWWESEYD